MEHSTTEGAEDRPQEDRTLIETWVTLVEMFGDEIAQEAMIVTLAAIEKGSLQKPPQHFFKKVANTLARRGYDDSTEERLERNHPAFLRSVSRLPIDGAEGAGAIMNTMYASGAVPEDGEIDYLSEQRATLFEEDWKTRPAPARISPLKRALQKNLQDWREFGALASSGPVRERPPEPPEPKRVKSSPHKGVSWLHEESCWRAELTVNKKRVFRGRFKTEAEAVAALEAARAQYQKMPRSKTG